MHEAPQSATSQIVDLDSTADGLFFVVGSGRCGTTLLQVMLDSHSQFCLPGETFFYDDFRRRNYWKYGEVDSDEKMLRVLKHALSTVYIRLFELNEDRVVELARTKEPSWETIFLAILTAFREKRGSPRVGEKSPGHINHLWYLYEKYPKARFIHLIRDPRAVVASFLSAPYYKEGRGSNPYRAIRYWMDAIDRHFEAEQKAGPARYLSLRYEDLVDHPQRELERVCAFLGVPFEESMMEYHHRQYSGFMASEVHKAGTFKPVYKDSVETWRGKLSPIQLWLIESLLCERMRRLGYQTELSKVPKWAELKFKYLLAMSKGRALRLKIGEVLKVRGQTGEQPDAGS